MNNFNPHEREARDRSEVLHRPPSENFNPHEREARDPSSATSLSGLYVF